MFHSDCKGKKKKKSDTKIRVVEAFLVSGCVMNQSHLSRVLVNLTAKRTSCMLLKLRPALCRLDEPRTICHFAPTRQASGSPSQYNRTCSKQLLPARDHF